MTRALGDLELNKYGVIAMPHTRSIQVGKQKIYVLRPWKKYTKSHRSVPKEINNSLSFSKMFTFLNDRPLRLELGKPVLPVN